MTEKVEDVRDDLIALLAMRIEILKIDLDTLLHAVKNLENDDNKIPLHAWNLLQTAIRDVERTR